jgi:hypothetical protein
MSPLSDQLRDLLADRHTPEARATFELLLGYVERRVRATAWRCCRDVLGEAQLEEVVSDVLLQLMTGALARFRGESVPELLGFVRTVTDRSLWRAARRVQREERAIDVDPANVERWSAAFPSPDALLQAVPDLPLSADDELYLRGLLQAGSKVNYANEAGVSRAAVTQRVKRIQTRISQLPESDRLAVDTWLEHTAHQVLARTQP